MPRSAPIFCCLALVLAGSARAAGPFDDLLPYTPTNTNTLVLIDVKGALGSPLATAEKWNEKGQPENRGGLGFVPSDASAVVIASEVNLTLLTRDCQVGLVKVQNLPNMNELARREGGSSDQIAGQVAALSPRDVYFTALPGSTLVALYPADRQYTARYLRAALAKKTGELSPYLKKASEAAGGSTVTIAVDLEDVVDRRVLALSLPASPSVAKSKTTDVTRLATFVAQVKGMTFSAKVTDKITASVAVDFPIEPVRFRAVLPDLLRELLEDQGIAIDGFENWKAEYTNTTMTLSGEIRTADLKRIVSLFAFPTHPGEPDPKVEGDAPAAGPTRRYLQAVDVILGDIARTRGNASYEKTATWHEKAADQITQLNRRNVDPAATEAAYQVARRLRAIGQSLRGVPIDQKALESQQYIHTYGGGRRWGVWPTGWWGLRPVVMQNPFFVDTNIPEIRAEMEKVTAADKQRRAETWSQIDKIMIDTKAALTDKYKTKF